MWEENFSGRRTGWAGPGHRDRQGVNDERGTCTQGIAVCVIEAIWRRTCGEWPPSFRPFLANNRAGLVSFSNRAPLIWNSLPADVREAPSLSSFKEKAFEHFERTMQFKVVKHLFLQPFHPVQ